MQVALVFVRDRRFYATPSGRFIARRRREPYPGGRPHYVLGEPPLGIMYLSAVLKRAGHEVTLTDQCHPEYNDDDYVAALQREQPDLVGLSFLSNMCYPAARALSRRIKAALPATTIVYGGVFATVNAERIVATEPAVDMVCRGEGEEVILDLAAGVDPAEVRGLTYRNDAGDVVENPARPPIRDLDALPFPDRDAIDINYVAALPLDVPAVIWDRPYTSIVSSRGCPYDCTYCNCPTFSDRKVRMRSAANVLSELAEIADRGYRAFSFLDDNFLLDTRRASAICAELVAHGPAFQWACEGRVDARGDGIFAQLAAAGCDLVMFGIESGSQRVLDSLRKRTRLNEVEMAVAQAHRAGIGIVHGFFIVGCPDETVAEIEATFALARRLPLNSFNFNSLTAFRGTPLWGDAVARGLIDDERDWHRMFRVHEIYPEAIDSATLFRVRSTQVKRLILQKVLTRPRDAARILRRFLASMSPADVYRLVFSTQSKPAAPVYSAPADPAAVA